MLTFIACGSDTASEAIDEVSEVQEIVEPEVVETATEDVIETETENESEEELEDEDYTLEDFYGSYLDLTEVFEADDYEYVSLECSANDLIFNYKFAYHVDVTDEIIEMLDSTLPDTLKEEMVGIEEASGLEINSVTVYLYNDDDSLIYTLIM